VTWDFPRQKKQGLANRTFPMEVVLEKRSLELQGKEGGEKVDRRLDQGFAGKKERDEGCRTP